MTDDPNPAEPLAPPFTTAEWLDAIEVRLRAEYQDLLTLQTRAGSDGFPQAISAIRSAGGSVQDALRSLDHVRTLWRAHVKVENEKFADSLPQVPATTRRPE